MRNLSLVLLLLTASSLSAASVCEKGMSGAKFACARAGDDQATLGNFTEAKKFWKISCEEGLSSSCETVMSMNQDLRKFKAEWNLDPANQSLKAQNLDFLKCKTDKTLQSKCLTKARNLEASHDSLQAAALLRGMCDANIAEACFFLGGIEVRNERSAASVQPYLKACSLGHKQACAVLSNVQTDLKQNAEREALLEKRRKDIAEKEKKEKVQNVKAVFTTLDILTGKPSPKLRCKSKQNDDGETETECFENPSVDETL